MSKIDLAKDSTKFQKGDDSIGNIVADNRPIFLEEQRGHAIRPQRSGWLHLKEGVRHLLHGEGGVELSDHVVKDFTINSIRDDLRVPS